MKKTLNIIMTIIAMTLIALAIAGASLSCLYALILLVPAFLALIIPVKNLISKIKFNANK